MITLQVPPDSICADGIPHMTYHDRELDLNFVWSGGSAILVCPHGYGEPATELIYVDSSVPRTLEEFQRICRLHLGMLDPIQQV